VAKKKKRTGPVKGLPAGSAPLPPPPAGTYDPAIDYNAQAAQRGYENQREDAATLYQQGQEDYGLDLGDLTRSRDYTLADLLTGRNRNITDLATSKARTLQDFDTSYRDVDRQYGILGRQQAESAAQHGITSQGLLHKSAKVRSDNKQLDQDQLTRSKNRAVEDIETNAGRVEQDYGTNTGRANTAFDLGKTRLDLGLSRTFGGYGGNTILNPITGQPAVGSLLTSLARAGTENTLYQSFSDRQRAQQAADNGYLPPGSLPRSPQSERQRVLDFLARNKAPHKGA
jgi:hypothetical protein